MAKKPRSKSPLEINPDESMMWSPGLRSLRRGRRRAPRTEVCRPCLIWHAADPEAKREGVVLDLNRHGMRVRMLDEFTVGDHVIIQLMRDDDFSIPLGPPINGKVVRNVLGGEGLADHGVELHHPEISRKLSRPAEAVRSAPVRRSAPRMHTVDITIGDRGLGRQGRRRG